MQPNDLFESIRLDGAGELNLLASDAAAAADDRADVDEYLYRSLERFYLAACHDSFAGVAPTDSWDRRSFDAIPAGDRHAGRKLCARERSAVHHLPIFDEAVR